MRKYYKLRFVLLVWKVDNTVGEHAEDDDDDDNG